MEKKNFLIAYYSKTGTTKAAAEKIAEVTGGTLFAVTPQKTYPGNYLATVAAAKIEQFKNELPALQSQPEGLENYDAVLVGFPIWWFTCPQLIKSFLAANDLSGKTVYPFCTHGGSGPKNSTQDMRKACPAADIKDCFDATKDLTEPRIKTWLGLD